MNFFSPCLIVQFTRKSLVVTTTSSGWVQTDTTHEHYVYWVLLGTKGGDHDSPDNGTRGGCNHPGAKISTFEPTDRHETFFNKRILIVRQGGRDYERWDHGNDDYSVEEKTEFSEEGPVPSTFTSVSFPPTSSHTPPGWTTEHLSTRRSTRSVSALLPFCFGREGGLRERGRRKVWRLWV